MAGAGLAANHAFNWLGQADALIELRLEVDLQISPENVSFASGFGMPIGSPPRNPAQLLRQQQTGTLCLAFEPAGLRSMENISIAYGLSGRAEPSRQSCDSNQEARA